MLDPNDPAVIAGARTSGISDEWLDAARRSPVYALAKTYRIALPLHPEYRTMPMVWYVPPLSPVVDAISRDGHDGEDPENLFGAIDALRIPIEYLAGLFSAGDTAVVSGVLKKLAAMRAYMRDINLGREPRADIPASVGMGEELMYEMYRLLAIAKYDARYVIPTAYATDGHRLEETVTECSLDFDGGPGMYTTGSGPFGETSGQPVPMAVESFQALKQRQTSEDVGVGAGRPSRVNLLNWDGKGSPDTMFAPRPGSPRLPGSGEPG
jgi:nitrate reductase beta subunit